MEPGVIMATQYLKRNLLLNWYEVKSLPGSSVHGISQAIVLEWIAISFSGGFSQPRDGTRVSRIVDRCFRAFNTLSPDHFSALKLDLDTNPSSCTQQYN